jgi:hypothetical protein
LTSDVYRDQRQKKAASENGCFANLGVDLEKIDKCIGEPEADVENEVLKAEQDTQVRSTKI